MSNISDILIIDEILKNNFSERTIVNGRRIFMGSNLIDPWDKGGFDNYLVLSAVISDLTTNQVRIKYKTETETLTSKCNCKNWNSADHCEHIVALLFHYQDLLKKRGIVQNQGDEIVRTSIHRDGHGVLPLKYGTIIRGASHLDGANIRSVYSSVQYRLVDGAIISFPMVSRWAGKLVVDLKPVEISIDDNRTSSNTSFYSPKFLYVDPNGNNVEQISLFEYLYLFDWKSGCCYELPNDIKDFIRKILFHESILPLDDYLRMSSEICKDGICKLSVDGVDINQFDSQPLHFRVSIEKGNRRNSLLLILESFDNADNQLPIHPLFQLLAFDNGLLSTFSRKSAAYEFAEKLTGSFEESLWNYKHLLRLSKEKDYIQDLISYLQKNDQISFMEDGNKTLYKFDSLTVKIFFKAMFKSFNEQFLRFAAYDPGQRQLLFDIPKRVLLDGVFDFYTMIKILGIPVYYNKNEIRPWNSQVRFDRKTMRNEWFDLNLNVSLEDHEIIKNADLGSNISLSNKGLVLLDPEQKNLLRLLKRYTLDAEATYSQEDAVVKYSLPLQRARIFELFELRRMGIDGALTPEDVQLCERLATLEKTPEYPVPAVYQEVARNYQKTGYYWLRFLYENKFGACLADDMGLGKTLQTIMFLDSIIDTVKRVLIVCPVSIMINWEKEFLKFSSLKPHIFYSGDREFDKSAKIVITSYGIMKREFADQFKDEKFDILIMDEVQHLKNIRSMGAIAARKLNVDFRLCLTGTPVENDLAEFYNILDLCVPGVWGDIRYIKSSSNKKTRLLAKMTVKPFILRRTKEQVLTELPPKEDNVILLNFSPEENEKYLSNLVKIRNRINESIPQRKYGAVLKGLLELRQMCLWQKHHHGMASTKIDFLFENLEQIIEEGHQVLIFSQFTGYLDMIQKRVEENHWKYSRIDGKKSYTKRQEEVDKFQSGERPIFLISLRAGGVGLNLTAASYIFLMDPWWNPAVESQAVDRAHRIGQENKLIVYRPVIKNSVEEKVLLLQDRKRELFQDLLGNDNDEFFTGKLTMKDFEDIIGD